MGSLIKNKHSNNYKDSLDNIGCESEAIKCGKTGKKDLMKSFSEALIIPSKKVQDLNRNQALPALKNNETVNLQNVTAAIKFTPRKPSSLSNNSSNVTLKNIDSLKFSDLIYHKNNNKNSDTNAFLLKNTTDSLPPLSLPRMKKTINALGSIKKKWPKPGKQLAKIGEIEETPSIIE